MVFSGTMSTQWLDLGMLEGMDVYSGEDLGVKRMVLAGAIIGLDAGRGRGEYGIREGRNPPDGLGDSLSKASEISQAVYL
jgi:hypothetical protein